MTQFVLDVRLVKYLQTILVIRVQQVKLLLGSMQCVATVTKGNTNLLILLMHTGARHVDWESMPKHVSLVNNVQLGDTTTQSAERMKLKVVQSARAIPFQRQ